MTVVVPLDDIEHLLHLVDTLFGREPEYASDVERQIRSAFLEKGESLFPLLALDLVGQELAELLFTDDVCHEAVLSKRYRSQKPIITYSRPCTGDVKFLQYPRSHQYGFLPAGGQVICYQWQSARYVIYTKGMSERRKNTAELINDSQLLELEVEPELAALTAELQTEPSTERRDEIINQLAQRVAGAEAPNQEVWEIEKTLAGVVTDQPPSLAVLVLLGELQPYRKAMFIEEGLAECLELGEGLSDAVIAQLHEINRSNKPEDNRLAIKIWEFALEYVRTVQNHVEQNLEEKLRGPYYTGLCRDIFDAAKSLAPRYLRYQSIFDNNSFAEGKEEYLMSGNYLVQKMRQEVCDSRRMMDSDKEGAILGYAGGNTDKTIFTFEHRLESYNNRRALGINQGTPILEPVLTISPGYFAYYEAGRVSHIYSEKDYDETVTTSERTMSDADYIKQNNQADKDYNICGRISESLPGFEAMRLDDIKDFREQLERSGRRYFFDLSKVDHNKLHPLVSAQLMISNARYIQDVEGPKNRATPLPDAEFQQLLSPGRELSDDEMRAYRTLTSLHMRKKIEDDFDLDLAECDFWTQRVFLSYLERQPLQTVEKLQAYTHRFGVDGLVAFLTLEADPNATSGSTVEHFMAATEEMPDEDARLVLRKVAALAEKAEGVRVWMSENLADQVEKNPDLVNQTVNGLLKRARAVLQLVNQVDRETLIADLEEVDADIQLIVNAFKSTLKSGEEIDLAELPGVEIGHYSGGQVPEVLKEQMMAVAQENWKLQPHLGEKIIPGLEAALKNKSIVFHVVSINDSVVAFFRMDEKSPDERYFASVNVRKQEHGYALAHVLMEQIFKQEADGYLVTADCDPWNPISESYVGDYGFVITDLDVDYAGTGHPIFAIRRDDRPEHRSQESYDLKGKSYHELLELKNNATESTGWQIKEYKLQVDLFPNLEDEGNAQFVADLVRRLDQTHGTEWVVTNYRLGPVSDGTRQVLVAYEPAASSSRTAPGASG